MTRAPLALALTILLGAAGCGDDKTSSTGSTTAARGYGDAVAADAGAKARARTLTTFLESCFADQQDYAKCDPATLDTGLPIGSGPGKVEVSSAKATTYVIVARSPSGNTFTITKQADGATKRTCEAGADPGGCKNGTW